MILPCSLRFIHTLYSVFCLYICFCGERERNIRNRNRETKGQGEFSEIKSLSFMTSDNRDKSINKRSKKEENLIKISGSWATLK